MSKVGEQIETRLGNNALQFVCLFVALVCLFAALKSPRRLLGGCKVCLQGIQRSLVPMVPLMIFEINCKSVKILEAPSVNRSLKVPEGFLCPYSYKVVLEVW